MKNSIKFAVLASIITIICGLIYTAVQQDIRQSANDPQIQIAQDTASAIEKNLYTPSSSQTDFANSLAPFIMIFNSDKNLTTSSGNMNGKMVVPPSGTFDSARVYGEDRITWQPKKTVRIAAVIVPVENGKKGYVLAGRNIREVENRESNLLTITGIAWATSLFLCGIFALL